MDYNLSKVLTEISAACLSCGRKTQDVTLVAVSKKKDFATIMAAYALGQRDFGENYVQEFMSKNAQNPPKDLRWHFIGHLQKNKVKDIVGRVHLIHTLDSMTLADRIQGQALKLGCIQDCLIEVKLSPDKMKSGVSPHELPMLLKHAANLANVRICGLMTMGSLTDNTETTRAEFLALKNLRDEVNAASIYPHTLTELSMGMSGDFTIAIACGATMVRVGSRIFGARNQ